MGGWHGSCGEDCWRGSEGSEMAAVVENRGREFTGERTMEGGLDSGRRRMMGGKREITPEREMVVMGMEMQGGGRGNREILQGELQQGRTNGKKMNGKKCDRGGSGKMAGNGERNVEGKMEMMAVRQSGGGGGPRRRRLEDGGVTVTVEKNRGRGKEWRRSSTAAAAAAAVAAAVGLLPRPSLSSHLRGRSLLSFFK